MSTFIAYFLYHMEYDSAQPQKLKHLILKFTFLFTPHPTIIIMIFRCVLYYQHIIKYKIYIQHHHHNWYDFLLTRESKRFVSIFINLLRGVWCVFVFYMCGAPPCRSRLFLFLSHLHFQIAQRWHHARIFRESFSRRFIYPSICFRYSPRHDDGPSDTFSSYFMYNTHHDILFIQSWKYVANIFFWYLIWFACHREITKLHQ